MSITERVRKARLQLAERVLESLYDGDLDEGFKSALMKGGLAAGLAAGAMGGGVKPDVTKEPTAVEAPSKQQNYFLAARQANIAKRKAASKAARDARMKDLLGTPEDMRNSAIKVPRTGDQPEDSAIQHPTSPRGSNTPYNNTLRSKRNRADYFMQPALRNFDFKTGKLPKKT
tara:strand:+ start:147 stop:665 length:519 start_codon:yes stop_codon:yes gene_type:complete